MNPITDLITEHLDDLAFSNNHTRRRRAQALRLFISNIIPLDNDCLKHFEQTFARAGLKPRTCSGYISDLRSFIIWLDAQVFMPDSINRSKSDARYQNY